MLCGSGFAWIRKMEEHLNPDPGGKNRQKCAKKGPNKCRKHEEFEG